MRLTFEVTQVQPMSSEVIVSGTPNLGSYGTGDNAALVNTVLNRVELHFPGSIDSPLSKLVPGTEIAVEFDDSSLQRTSSEPFLESSDEPKAPNGATEAKPAATSPGPKNEVAAKPEVAAKK
jgi:hypothetical protein